MDEDTIIESGKASVAVPETPRANPESDADEGSGKVFEITPDLNISQINEKSENEREEARPATVTNTNVTPPAPPPAIRPTIPTAPATPIQPIPPPVTTPPPSVTAPPPPATPKSNEADAESNLQSLRTYESDVAKIMSQRKTSVAKIVMAEKAKNEEAENVVRDNTPSHAGRKIFLTLLSLILLLLGVGAAYYLYRGSALFPAVTPTSVPSDNLGAGLIPSDDRVVISIDRLGRQAIAGKVREEAAKPLSAGTLREIVFVRTLDQAQVRVSAGDMARLMGIGAPDSVLRSLSKDWMMGIVGITQGKNDIFVLTTNDFFQNAFSGMLSWEKVMADDLKDFLIADGNVIRGQFVDRIIANRDVREYVNADGVPLFLYSFIDQERMVVANSESVLAEIVARLDRQAFLR